MTIVRTYPNQGRLQLTSKFLVLVFVSFALQQKKTVTKSMCVCVLNFDRVPFSGKRHTLTLANKKNNVCDKKLTTYSLSLLFRHVPEQAERVAVRVHGLQRPGEVDPLPQHHPGHSRNCDLSAIPAVPRPKVRRSKTKSCLTADVMIELPKI